MGAPNLGKKFEDKIKNSFLKVPETFILRLHDDVSGHWGVRNPCDFVAYKKPTMVLLECKSCRGKSLPLSNITEYQHDSLLSYDSIRGVVAGYIIWFIDRDLTIFIRARVLEDYIEQGYKSFNVDKMIDDDYIILTGKKKRTFFDYDLTDFFDKL